VGPIVTLLCRGFSNAEASSFMVMSWRSIFDCYAE